MEFHQVRYFVAVSKHLNFTRAAEVCNVTQPALTKAIQKLEYELGGELIFRERHLTQLTELGKLVLPTLEKMLEAADAVRIHARDFKHKALAPLKIGLSPCISATLIVDLLTEIARAVPGLQVELIEASSSELSELLLEGELGAAFTSGVDGLPDRIDHWRLFEERFVVFTAADTALADLQVVPLEALKDQIWLERAGCDVIKKFWAAHFGATEPRILHRGRQETHLHQMVAAGLGIILAANHVRCPNGIVARPIEGDPLRHEVQLLVVAGRRYTPALETLIRTTRNHDWSRHRIGAGQGASSALRVARERIPAHWEVASFAPI